MSMSTFGDTEPEDAWDPGDPFGVLVDNLFRRLALLEQESPAFNRRELLDLLDIRLSRLRILRSLLSDRDRLRLDQLDGDITFLRARVNDG